MRRQRVRPTKLTKSEQMARVRSRNTGLEILLRRSLWLSGVRYRLHPRLPGTPDMAFMSARVAVFVDGCFWHGCPAHYTKPVSNSGFWAAKLNRNRERDCRVDAELEALGWKVCRIWEHDVTDNLLLTTRRIRTLVLKRLSRKVRTHA